MKKILAILMIPAMTLGANLDVRHLYITNDVSSAVQSVAPQRWYQGESVTFDLWAQRGSTPIDLSGSGLFARWEVNLASNNTLLYICSTGTLTSATNGQVRFELSPAYGNLPTNTYASYVKVYQPVNTTNRYVGCVYKSTAQVMFSPSATNITYLGPFTNSTETDPVFKASAAGGITVADTNLWTAASASTTNAVTVWVLQYASPSNHNQTISTITDLLTTRLTLNSTNYLITGEALTSVTNHNQAWSTITATPVSLSGYGITNDVIYGASTQLANFVSITNAHAQSTGTGVHGVGSIAASNNTDYALASEPVFATWTNSLSFYAGQGAFADNYGFALGDLARAELFGAALGHGANGTNYGAALGSGAKGNDFGVAIGGNFPDGTNYGVSIGYGSQGASWSVAVGNQANGSGTGNVAVGKTADANGAGNNLTDTTEIGTGVATNNGWFHYRGKAVIDSLGQTMGASVSGAVANASALGNLDASLYLTNGATATAGLYGPDATMTNQYVNLEQMIDSLSSLSILTLYGSTNNNFFGTSGSLLLTPEATAYSITNIFTGASNIIVGAFYFTNAYDKVNSGNYVMRWYVEKQSGNRTITAKIRWLTRLNGATAVTQGVSAATGPITTLSQQRVTVYAANTVVGTQVVAGVEYELTATGGGQNTPVVTWLGAPYNAHVETPGLGTTDLGIRGATNIVDAMGNFGSYNYLTRVLTSPAERGSWGYVDGNYTNGNNNIERFSPSSTITLTNFYAIADGGTSTYDVVFWANYTNSLRSYTTIVTGMVCTGVASNLPISKIVSNYQWVGLICTGLVNGASNSCVQLNW